jgi:hypothetical protein
MKSIVHIGLPKTGTTALQSALRSSHKKLLSCKVLYPTNLKSYNGSDHTPLAASLKPYSSMTRGLRDYYKIKSQLDIKFSRYINEIEHLIASTSPKALILSSERLATEIHPSHRLDKFKKLVGSEVKFVVYFRRPSERYVSTIMEHLKGSDKIPSYRPRIISLIDTYEYHFGSDALDVHLLSSQNKNKPDVISNFTLNYLSPYNIFLEQLSREKNVNTTLSAESMLILREYRKTFFHDKENKYISCTRELVKVLRQIDIDLNISKPKLKAGIANRIDYASNELIELRDRKGVIIPNIDYDRLERGNYVAPLGEIACLKDILLIDSGLKIEIINNTLLSNWCSVAAERECWLRSLMISKESQ